MHNDARAVNIAQSARRYNYARIVISAVIFKIVLQPKSDPSEFMVLVQPKSGLLQSAIISLFLSYITLTSLANEPLDIGKFIPITIHGNL